MPNSDELIMLGDTWSLTLDWPEDCYSAVDEGALEFVVQDRSVEASESGQGEGEGGVRDGTVAQ